MCSSMGHSEEQKNRTNLGIERQWEERGIFDDLLREEVSSFSLSEAQPKP